MHNLSQVKVRTLHSRLSRVSDKNVEQIVQVACWAQDMP